MKPMLFNTEMVRAILEGRKTVTRRLMKPQPAGAHTVLGWNEAAHMVDLMCGNGGEGGRFLDWVETIKAPIWPGDVLWVRETWRPFEVGCPPAHSIIEYKAGGTEKFDEIIALPTVEGKWRPSIHMPRKAARIFLRVTDVRAERLQEITEDGAKAEGAEKSYPYTDPETGKTVFVLDEKGTYRSGFSQIWDRTIKPKDRVAYCWESTPWVWVIEFERIIKERPTMTNEEAIEILQEEHNYCQEPYFVIKAIEKAIEALSGQPTGKPLTLEQLREMDGRPVFVTTERWGNFWALVNENSVYKNNAKVFFFDEASPEYGKTWIAYAYPPAHIDREAWTGCVCNSGKKNCITKADRIRSMNDEELANFLSDFQTVGGGLGPEMCLEYIREPAEEET